MQSTDNGPPVLYAQGMFPIIAIGAHRFSAFFFMIAVAIFIAALYILFQAKRRGLCLRHVAGISILAIATGLVGMRVFHVLVEAPRYYWEHPAQAFHLSGGGFVSWGAVLGVLAATLFYAKIAGLPLWRYLDTFALGFPIILFLVRIGCLGAGCCYGKPVDHFPLSVVFTDPRSVAAHYYPGFPLHATQLYAMLNALVLFVLLHLVARRQRFEGQVFALFAIGYGLLRATLEEGFRADFDRGIYGGLISTGQIMGILLVGFGIAVYVKKKTSTRFP